MASHEVFPNAPLAYVACEIQFPIAPGASRDETFEKLADGFANLLPLPEREQVQLLSLGGTNPTSELETRFRFLDQPRTMSVVVSRSTVSIETTHYVEWEAFKSFVLQAVEIVGRIVRIVGVTRIGLRYIDEIRVSTPMVDVTGWSGWVAEDLVAPAALMSDEDPVAYQSIVQFGSAEQGVTVRYAALRGPGVVGDAPLKRKALATDGPYFTIDTDSYQTFQGEAMPVFETSAITDSLSDLHNPVGKVFHSAITDQLRKEFRRTP